MLSGDLQGRHVVHVRPAKTTREATPEVSDQPFESIGLCDEPTAFDSCLAGLTETDVISARKPQGLIVRTTSTR